MEAAIQEEPRAVVLDDPRWKATIRVTESVEFAKATRLSQFLLYVCQCALEGRQDEVSEQQIGVAVFGKPATFNASDETIVRATARQLRQRLAVYYQEVGSKETLRISIPRGGYLPVFTETQPQNPPSVLLESLQEVRPEPLELPHPVTTSVPLEKRSWKRYAMGALAGWAVAAAFYATYYFGTHRLSESALLWQQIFNNHQQTFIVVGDAGLNMFENLSHQQVDLNEYVSRSYLESPFARTPPGYTWDPLATRTYTTIQNLQLAWKLAHLSYAYSDRTQLKFARELSMDDLKDSNAVLMGAPQYDPWQHLFEKNLNFTVNYDGVANTITVKNHAPHQGEQAEYTWRPNDPQHLGYALITLTDNLAHDGKVLLVQGTTAAGDDAASTYLFDKNAMSTLMARVTAANHTVSNFQILLETRTVVGDSYSSRIIAERISQ